MQQPTAKKRRFDIASLVDDSNDSSCSKSNRNEQECQIKVDDDIAKVTTIGSAFHRPKYLPQLRHTSLSLMISTNAINSQSQSHSAFKKVDQKNSSLGSPYDYSSLYHRVAASALMPTTTNPTPLNPSVATSIGTPLSTTGSKSFISSTLLPYLPPSLAALTFPTSNWCAKCNATFRMTSDLVYHMRSHHSEHKVDPIKKKREEKLRCHICHETFRERHHLTRHMTSHQ